LLPLFLLLPVRFVRPLLLLGAGAFLVLLLLHALALLLLLLAPFVRVGIRRVWRMVRRVRCGSRRVGIWGRPICFRPIGIGVRVRLGIGVRGPIGRRICVGRPVGAVLWPRCGIRRRSIGRRIRARG